MAYCAAACLLLPAQGTTGNKDLGGGRVPGAWAVATRTPVSGGFFGSECDHCPMYLPSGFVMFASQAVRKFQFAHLSLFAFAGYCLFDFIVFWGAREGSGKWMEARLWVLWSFCLFVSINVALSGCSLNATKFEQYGKRNKGRNIRKAG